MKQSGVYVLKNKENNKRYVGLSCEINRRLTEHIRCVLFKIDHPKNLYIDLDNFSNIEINFFPLELYELSDIEIFMIWKHQAEYNTNLGGDKKYSGYFDLWNPNFSQYNKQQLLNVLLLEQKLSHSNIKTYGYYNLTYEKDKLVPSKIKTILQKTKKIPLQINFKHYQLLMSKNNEIAIDCKNNKINIA
jgi:hypothetical protein